MQTSKSICGQTSKHLVYLKSCCSVFLRFLSHIPFQDIFVPSPQTTVRNTENQSVNLILSLPLRYWVWEQQCSGGEVWSTLSCHARIFPRASAIVSVQNNAVQSLQWFLPLCTAYWLCGHWPTQAEISESKRRDDNYVIKFLPSLNIKKKSSFKQLKNYLEKQCVKIRTRLNYIDVHMVFRMTKFGVPRPLQDTAKSTDRTSRRKHLRPVLFVLLLFLE